MDCTSSIRKLDQPAIHAGLDDNYFMSDLRATVLLASNSEEAGPHPAIALLGQV
jgi:hypothetical protein